MGRLYVAVAALVVLASAVVLAADAKPDEAPKPALSLAGYVVSCERPSCPLGSELEVKSVEIDKEVFALCVCRPYRAKKAN